MPPSVARSIPRVVRVAPLCAALGAACARQPAAESDGAAAGARYGGTVEGTDAAAIRRARMEQNAAIATQNLDGVAGFWTEDVTITAGLGRVLRGREAYRAAFAADSALRYTRFPEHVEVSAGWPLAFERGVWEGRRRRDPSTPLLGGAYAAQWVKQEGRWVIHSEVFVAMYCAGEACSFPVAAPTPP